MKNVEYWNVFEQTGSIDAYLLYACASESESSENDEEGEANDKSRKYYGNGTFFHTGRGLR